MIFIMHLVASQASCEDDNDFTRPDSEVEESALSVLSCCTFSMHVMCTTHCTFLCAVCEVLLCLQSSVTRYQVSCLLYFVCEESSDEKEAKDDSPVPLLPCASCQLFSFVWFSEPV